MIAADIITIVLNHNANPLKQTISDFAIGPYGYLEKIGMVMVAISFLFIAINLLMVRNNKELRIFKFVGVLFVIVALGFVMISIFNTNVIGTIDKFSRFGSPSCNDCGIRGLLSSLFNFNAFNDK